MKKKSDLTYNLSYSAKSYYFIINLHLNKTFQIIETWYIFLRHVYHAFCAKITKPFELLDW